MGRKRTVFTGCSTALITPFSGGEIDYFSLGELIESQIASGTDALVLLGTTGEAPTVNEDERAELISFARDKIKKRVPLIVGTGTNSTEVSVRYTKMAEELGADCCLTVTPYYNKASEDGLLNHFYEIARGVKLPIILYNVPTRTLVNIPMSVYEGLCQIENIVGVKEASGNLSYTAELISSFGKDFDVYTGCDEMCYSTLCLGGRGVISVLSNIMPSRMHQLCYEYMRGERERSLELQLYLNPMIKELFKEINPIGVKAAASLMGICSDEIRLPLYKSSRKESIQKALYSYGLLS